MRLNLVTTLRCNGCGRESEPFKIEVQLRPEVGVQFLPPEAPKGWQKSLDRAGADPLRYFCQRCQRTASGARPVPIVVPARKHPGHCQAAPSLPLAGPPPNPYEPDEDPWPDEPDEGDEQT